MASRGSISGPQTQPRRSRPTLVPTPVDRRIRFVTNHHYTCRRDSFLALGRPTTPIVATVSKQGPIREVTVPLRHRSKRSRHGDRTSGSCHDGSEPASRTRQAYAGCGGVGGAIPYRARAGVRELSVGLRAISNWDHVPRTSPPPVIGRHRRIAVSLAVVVRASAGYEPSAQL